MEPFSIDSERIGQAHWLTPVGELDIATAPIFERACVIVVRSDAEMIVVDLRRLTFMDATGVRLLLHMDEICEDARLRIIGGAAIERLLELSGVRDRLPIVAPGADPLAPRPPCRA